MNNRQKIILLDKEIRNSKGSAYINRRHSRAFQDHLFYKNHYELNELLTIMDNTKIAIELWSLENREKLSFFHHEANRLFHNYMAGLKTKIEHERIFINKYYQNTNVFKYYQEYINNNIKNNGMIKFIEDLRNYTVHKALPINNVQLKYDAKDGMKSGFFIPKKTLLKWDKWSKISLSYLESLSDEINPKNLVDEYHAEMDKFNDWLVQLLDDYHEKDIDDYNNLIETRDILEKSASDAIEII